MAETTIELTVLSSAMNEPRYFVMAKAGGIQESSFSNPQHAQLWAAMEDCGWAIKVDIAALVARLKSKGVQEPMALVRKIGEAASHAWGSETVGAAIKELTAGRQSDALKAILDEIRALRADSSVDLLTQVSTLQSRLSQLAGQVGAGEGNSHNIGADQAAAEILDILAAAPVGLQPGLRSRFAGLNEMLGGYEPGTVTVFGGRTSVGKSTLMCWEAIQLTYGGTVLYFSLEMSAKQLTTKLLSMLTGIDGNRIRRHDLKLEERQRLVEAGNHPCFKRIKIIDSMRAKPSYMRAVLARESGRVAQAGDRLAAAVVDHLLLMGSDNARQGTRERIMECSAAMKSLAKEFNLPFLVLTQLKRDVEKPGEVRRPSLVDLKESSSLEEDADAVVLLHGDRAAEELTLIVAKNREGQLGEVALRYHKTAQTFTEGRAASPFAHSEALRQLEALEPELEGAFFKDGADQLRFIDEIVVQGGERIQVGQHSEGVLEGNRLSVTLSRHPGEQEWVKSYYCYCREFQHDPEHRACRHIKAAHARRNESAKAGHFRKLEKPTLPDPHAAVREESAYVTTAPVMATKA